MIGHDVYLLDYVRTPFSRARPQDPSRDAFSDYFGVELAALTLKDLFEHRLKGILEKTDVSQYYFGCAMPYWENVLISGKTALWLAQFPDEIPAVAVERQCGSGMTAMHQGIMEIAMGYGNVSLVSGMESQTRVPMHNNPYIKFDTNVADPRSPWFNAELDLPTSLNMLQTAQKLFEQEIDHFSKKDLDQYAVKSHNLTERAIKAGFFKNEILPVKGHKEGDLNTPEVIEHDLSVRFGLTVDQMEQLRIVSKPGWAGGYQNPIMNKEQYHQKTGSYEGVITPGNSSPMNAGAASAILVSEKQLQKIKVPPLAKIIEIGVAAVDPTVMGRGPVPATQKALQAANLSIDDIDFWEINEAFTIVALNAIKDLGIEESKVNVKGGATAIGHPLAATGIRMAGTLAHILKENNARYGCANMCCGGGQGTAVIIENLEAS